HSRTVRSIQWSVSLAFNSFPALLQAFRSSGVSFERAGWWSTPHQIDGDAGSRHYVTRGPTLAGDTSIQPLKAGAHAVTVGTKLADELSSHDWRQHDRRILPECLPSASDWRYRVLRLIRISVNLPRQVRASAMGYNVRLPVTPTGYPDASAALS